MFSASECPQLLQDILMALPSFQICSSCAIMQKVTFTIRAKSNYESILNNANLNLHVQGEEHKRNERET